MAGDILTIAVAMAALLAAVAVALHRPRADLRDQAGTRQPVSIRADARR